jgi:trehalose 6-phosphate synthase
VTGPLVASNRGPVAFATHGDAVVARRGGGGLVTAMGPALAAEEGAMWIAAAGTPAERAVAAHPGPLRAQLPQGSVRLRLLAVDDDDYDAYYNQVANRVLWPLLHRLFDTAREPRFDDDFVRAWARYRSVNERFADACAAEPLSGGAFVQDYHLALVPGLLRARRGTAAIAHYTHCPWAEPDTFAMLPDGVRAELLAGMLGADLLCFEVPRWRSRFLACCREAGYRTSEGDGSVLVGARQVHTRAYPLGVDAADLDRQAGTAPVRDAVARLRRQVGDRKAIVRVDRMEPSKNILRGLHAYELLLERDPSLRGEVVHLVFAYGSRQDVPEYRAYAEQVTAARERINHRFGGDGWHPVRLSTADDFPAALAGLTLADVVVVNSLYDGQNLVAKEAPLANGRDAVLILSRNAGAADDLAGAATLVNPFDTAQLAGAMAAALTMSPRERARRAALLRAAAVVPPPVEWFARQRGDLASVVAGKMHGNGDGPPSGVDDRIPAIS